MTPKHEADTLAGIIKSAEKRLHENLKTQADLRDRVDRLLKAGDTETAQALSQQLKCIALRLERQRKDLSRLFKLAMDKTMQRVRQDDRDT